MQYYFSANDLDTGTQAHAHPYFEFLKHPALSAGIYMLKAGEPDLQRPHIEDEVYYILEGRSKMTVDREELSVAPGDLIYVPAYLEHRFFDIVEDLKVLVFFSSASTDEDDE